MQLLMVRISLNVTTPIEMGNLNYHVYLYIEDNILKGSIPMNSGILLFFVSHIFYLVPFTQAPKPPTRL